MRRLPTRPMHEVSIMQSVMEMAIGKLGEAGYQKIDSITLRIGGATGILTDSLRFAFDALKPGTPVCGAVLHIEEVPVGGVCLGCGEGFSTPEKFVFSCPLCGHERIRITQGRELDLTGLEVS